MAKKTWYRLLSLLVCLALALPCAAATEEAYPDADADEVAYLEADGEADSRSDSGDVAHLQKAGDVHTENGFVAQERDDGFLTIIDYKETLGDNGILKIPATIDGIEVKQVSALFGDNPGMKNFLKEVRLPEGLQVLGNVFQNCLALETVYIPSTLESATSPFSGCVNLSDVRFGVALPRVPATLFDGCTGLTKIELPAQATVVESNAFSNCSNLETIVFHPNHYLTEIQASAFQGCSSLEKLSLPSGLRTMGDSAFAKCAKLKYVWIPASLRTAGSEKYPVFSGCDALSEVEFEPNIPLIADNLFASCVGLKEIEIPGTVESIGYGAFARSGLEHIEIPDSVTSYGDRTFRECPNLKEAKLSKLAPAISVRMFYKCYFLETLSVDPGTVTSIGKEAFYECKRLINLPAWTALESIGNSAFFRCELLESITLPKCLTSLGSSAFQYDAMLNKVVIPSMLTTIPGSAFAQCYRLADISIPKSVKTIANQAFYQDTDLKRVFIPASVTSIGDNAFSYVDLMIIEGASGSYAEEWAAQNGAKEFVDKSVPVKKISLAGGGDSLILPVGGLVAPVFDMYPADNTDVLTLTSSNSAVKVRKGYILYCTRNLTEPVTITVTATSDSVTQRPPFTFTVTCENMTGLDICYPPEVTDYRVGDTADWAGLVPQAVFNSGAVQPLYNYPPTADTIKDNILAWTADELDTESEGTKAVTVNYDKFSTEFSAQVYADADEIPFTLRRVESTANGFRLLTNGVAGEARYCAVVAFDEEGRFVTAAFRTLSDEDVASGYADFSGVAANAASVKAVLFDGDEAFAPVQFTRPLSVFSVA